jgi:hypothetical protein
MRSHHLRWSWRLWTLGVMTLALASAPSLAFAQASINPTATPTRNDGGWVYWMAIAAAALSVLIIVLIVAAYLRFSPRFQREVREEEAARPAHAPPVTEVRLQYTPPPAPVAAPVPAAVGAAAPAPAAAAAPAPAPAAAAAPAAAEAPPAAAAAPATPAAAPRPATPKQEGPLELDQETFDRVLQEQLDKGTDRRVAEGRARSAAAKAARQKAGE